MPEEPSLGSETSQDLPAAATQTGSEGQTPQTPGDRGQGQSIPARAGGHGQEKGEEATVGRSRFRVETAAVGIQRFVLTS